jgi:hypothetical protein
MTDEFPNPLEYQRADPERSWARSRQFIANPRRDLYVPCLLMVAGFLAMEMWAVLERHANAHGLFVMSLATPLAALFPTMVFFLAASALVRRIGFAANCSATLRFAAIIVFIDASAHWLNTAMKSTGAIAGNGTGSIRAVLVSIMGSATIIICISQYLFATDVRTVGWAQLLAIISWIVGRTIGFILLSLIQSLTAGGLHPASSPAATPVISSNAVSQNSGALTIPSPAPSALDEEISRRIEKIGPPSISDARDWEKIALGDANTRQLIRAFYSAGAKTIHVDMAGQIPGNTTEGYWLMLYVELPNDSNARAACMAVLASYGSGNGEKPIVITEPEMHQFILMGTKNVTPGN